MKDIIIGDIYRLLVKQNILCFKLRRFKLRVDSVSNQPSGIWGSGPDISVVILRCIPGVHSLGVKLLLTPHVAPYRTVVLFCPSPLLAVVLTDADSLLLGVDSSLDLCTFHT